MISKRIIRQFKKHKLGVFGFWVVVILYVVMIFSDFIAPYSYQTTHSKFSYAPPSKIHFYHEGKFVGPFVYGVKKERDPVTFLLKFEEDKTQMYRIKLFVRGEEYSFFGIKSNIHLFGLEADPQEAMLLLFGADRFGRDLFSRTLIGSKVSLTACLLGTFISLVIGAIIGAISGYYGGWVDIIIQRISEVLRSFPRIQLWLAHSVILTPNWPIT
ncbi:MAG: hypothetical protein P3W91_002750 [Fervidobacterium sp.]|nr:hypothetical protein [Fervidobacterium sp.]